MAPIAVPVMSAALFLCHHGCDFEMYGFGWCNKGDRRWMVFIFVLNIDQCSVVPEKSGRKAVCLGDEGRLLLMT